MFESAELGHAIDKRAYARQVPRIRADLLELQTALAEGKSYPVIVLVGGVDGAGKGETVNKLNEWMDPRHIKTHAMGELTDEERERPPMWRFWRALPPKGETGIFFGSWYTQPILDRVYGRAKKSELERQIEDIVRFERMLADEGALIVKFWLHLSKKAQKKRLEKLARNRATRWRVNDEDWEHHRRYDEFRPVSERVLRETSMADAPWIVVEATDERYRNLTVAKVLRDAMKKRSEDPEREKKKKTVRIAPLTSSIDKRDVLHELDLTKKLDEHEYKARLDKARARLSELSRDKGFRKISVVMAFEGNDAAGKGGTIRRLTRALDARQYEVVPIAAPTEEERAQPYLWRFWRRLPRIGHFTIFDRSWYGRVLVERVEGLCAERGWMRAYTEINDFEERLTEHGVVVLKFWMSISKEEQAARFEARKKTAFKRYKITEEDWRNRKKWSAYEQAVVDMVDRTSTDVAPWKLVEANDKKYARVKVIEAVCDRIAKAL